MPQQDRIDDILKGDDKQEPITREQWQRINDSWTFLLSSRKGRVVLRDLLLLTRFGKSAFGGDSETTLVNSGLQMVGEYIIEKLSECYPEAYSLMLTEAKEDEEYDRQSKQSSAGNSSDSSTG